MLAASQKKPAKSVRYYLWREEGLLRIASQLHHDILDGKIPVAAFAGARQKLVEVLIDPLTTDVRKVTARGIYYDFDERGLVDLRALRQAALESLAPISRFASKVIDLEHILQGKRFRRKYNWAVPPEVFDLITADVSREKSELRAIPWFRLTARATDAQTYCATVRPVAS